MICIPLPSLEMVAQIAYWYIIAGSVFVSVIPFVVIAIDGIKAEPYKNGGIGIFALLFLVWPIPLIWFLKDRLD